MRVHFVDGPWHGQSREVDPVPPSAMIHGAGLSDIPVMYSADEEPDCCEVDKMYRFSYKILGRTPSGTYVAGLLPYDAR